MRKGVSITVGLCVCWLIVLAGSNARAINGKAVRLQQGMGPQAQETYYATLQEALDQVANNFAQITLQESLQESVEYRGMYSITLDLNGHMLTGTEDTALTHTGYGAMTLKSGVAGGGIQGTKQGILVNSQRGLTIQSGIYQALGPGGVAIVNETGKVSIQEYGGKIQVEGAVALRDHSDQVLELDGGQLIGRDAGFAVEKLAGSLAMDGDIQIQGKLGGLLLHTGPTGQEVAPGEKSVLYLEDAAVQAMEPAGVAIEIYAAPGWEVELCGDGTLTGDTALKLDGGTLTILEGAQVRLDGKVVGGDGLLLQGGRYREAPKEEWLSPGLYATRDTDGWYVLGTTPPADQDDQDIISPNGLDDGQQPGNSMAIDAGQAVPSIPIPQGEGEPVDRQLFLPKTGQGGSWALPALLAAGSLSGLMAGGGVRPKRQEYRKSGRDH